MNQHIQIRVFSIYLLTLMLSAPQPTFGGSPPPFDFFSFTRSFSSIDRLSLPSSCALILLLFRSLIYFRWLSCTLHYISCLQLDAYFVLFDVRVMPSTIYTILSYTRVPGFLVSGSPFIHGFDFSAARVSAPPTIGNCYLIRIKLQGENLR
jgi:hypothetical protein